MLFAHNVTGFLSLIWLCVSIHEAFLYLECSEISCVMWKGPLWPELFITPWLALWIQNYCPNMIIPYPMLHGDMFNDSILWVLSHLWVLSRHTLHCSIIFFLMRRVARPNSVQNECKGSSNNFQWIYKILTPWGFWWVGDLGLKPQDYLLTNVDRWALNPTAVLMVAVTLFGCFNYVEVLLTNQSGIESNCRVYYVDFGCWPPTMLISWLAPWVSASQDYPLTNCQISKKSYSCVTCG